MNLDSGGYGPSVGPAAASTIPPYKWVDIERNHPIPTGALRAGWTKRDGPVYVGTGSSTSDREVGKINLCANGNTELIETPHMYNFWAHGCITAEKVARIMVCDASMTPVWLYLTRGDLVPKNAVKVAEALPVNSMPNTKSAALTSRFMTKLGLKDKKGELYVGRFNGEPGAVEVKDGSMSSFWSHHWGERGTVEILVLESAAGNLQLQSQAAVDPGPLPIMQTGAGCVDLHGVLEESSAASNMPQELPQPELQKIRLKVMQFNIWQEGWEVADGLDKIADVIIASEADIVTLSEVRNWSIKYIPKPYNDFHVRLTKALRAKKPGTAFYGSWVEGCDTGLVSKFPIEYADSVTEAKRSLTSAHFIRTSVGPLCIYSAHLDWKNYALNLVRGYDADTFKRMESPVTNLKALHEMDGRSGRCQSHKDFVKHARGHKCPVILAGDFNECSHLDWKEATKDIYGHAGVTIEWKHSKFLQDEGFTDSWRELYPDPVTHMGATWPSEAYGKTCTSWATESDERDRIDFIYYGSTTTSRLRPLAGHLVGSRGYFKCGRQTNVYAAEDASPFLPATQNLAWPSDHKAVLVEFELETVSK